MILKNVQVYTEDKRFEEGEIRIEEGRFAENEGAGDGIELDGEGCYAIPGLVDLHFHGCKGYDFCEIWRRSRRSRNMRPLWALRQSRRRR